MVGGTGSTISLLIAIFIFSRQKSAKQVARLSGAGFIQYQRTGDFWSADCL
jgi:cellobiose-specific phosphotransferase system component IIC